MFGAAPPNKAIHSPDESTERLISPLRFNHITSVMKIEENRSHVGSSNRNSQVERRSRIDISKQNSLNKQKSRSSS